MLCPVLWPVLFLWYSNPCFELVSKNFEYTCDLAVVEYRSHLAVMFNTNAIRLFCWIQVRFGCVVEYRCDSAVLLNDSAMLLNDSQCCWKIRLSCWKQVRFGCVVEWLGCVVEWFGCVAEYRRDSAVCDYRKLRWMLQDCMGWQLIIYFLYRCTVFVLNHILYPSVGFRDTLHSSDNNDNFFKSPTPMEAPRTYIVLAAILFCNCR